MATRRDLLISSLCCAPFLVSGVWAEETPNADLSADKAIKDLGFEVLTGDSSRQELFENVKTALLTEEGPQTNGETSWFNLNGPFKFPDDVGVDKVLKAPRVNSIFGVDLSHYTSRDFPIEDLRSNGARFVYMKTTQGARYVDDHFADFWRRAADLPPGKEVHRGAYHFLSAGDPGVTARDWGIAQAKTFVAVIRANKGLRKTDMPPVVDLEWDRTPNDPDRWSQREPDDIIEVVLGFLEQVKGDLGVAPMIYTARSWWNGRIKSEAKIDKLSGYRLWGADYSRLSRASETPKPIHHSSWAMWQFTSAAKMASGFTPGFDANIFKGSEDQFYQTFGMARFS